MMSIVSNFIDSARQYLRVPAIEADVKALYESLVAADIRTSKIEAVAHNEQLKFGCMLHELQNSISVSNARFEDERHRRDDAEKILTCAIAMLTNKITRIERLVDQRIGSAGNLKEQ